MVFDGLIYFIIVVLYSNRSVGDGDPSGGNFDGMDTRRVFTCQTAEECAGVVVGDKYGLRPVVVKRVLEDGEYYFQMLPDYHPGL